MEARQTIPLGDLCRIELGGTPARKNSELWDQDKKTDNVWLSIADLPQTLNARVTDSKEYISDEAAKKARLVREGTLLVSFKLTLGRLAYAGRDLFTNEAIAALNILDERFITRAYLYWYLTFFDWQKAAEGDHKIKGKTLNKAKLKSLPVLVPPLPEQEQAVAILDEVFAAIAAATANAEKSLANARELFESELDSVFGDPASDWHPVQLDEVVDLLSGFAFKSKEYAEQGHFLVRIGNVQDGRLSTERPKFVQLDERTHRFALQSGDLLVSLTGNIGRVARAEEADLPAALNQRVARLRLSDTERVDAGFLYVFLRSSVFREGLIDAGHGVAQQNVSPKTIAQLTIYLPDITEQRRVANLLRDMAGSSGALQRIAGEKLALLTELKQSILHKAFTGELTADPDTADRTLSEAGI